MASPGATFANLANLTSSVLDKLPPSLLAYLDTASVQLASASQYLRSATGLSPSALYGTAAAVLLIGAVPTVLARTYPNKQRSSQGNGKMSRFGWSSRGGISPYNSTLGQGVPTVTDEDFSYITSEDLENHGVEPADRLDRQDNPEEDDVLLLKIKGITYPTKFPAYSIGDSKLLVCDLRDRIKLMLKLSDRRARRMRMIYKGRELKSSVEPVREYGVKNNSEIMVILPDTKADSSDESSEEIVVVGQEEEAPKKKKKRSRAKKRESPRDSGSNVGLDVPPDHSRRGVSHSRTHSPASAVSAASNVSGMPGGPIEKLNAISSNFNTKLLPLCVQYTANPPEEQKKREDEHRKISETVMQQVLLKLDEVDTSAEEGARGLRKELVHQVQSVLKSLDEAKSRR